jgi:lysophospholipase L1-like esterase
MRQRRLGTFAAYVGGAVTAAGALAAGLLGGQVVFARRTIPGAEAPPPQCGGRYGRQYEPATGQPEGTPFRLAVLGDSTAAGYGVHTRAETPGAMLATAVADALHAPVDLTCPAAVGSPSSWLPAQAENALEAGSVDLAVIFIGANDVTTGASEERAVAFLAQAVRALRAAGADVIVATCPDLGTVRPILPPLRWVVRRTSRRLAHAQRAAVRSEGALTVSLGDLLGPTFDADPATMFGPDRYHPSALGYRAAVDVVMPTVVEALKTIRKTDGTAAGRTADGVVPCVSKTT